MADIVLLIEEQRAAMRDAERELSEAMTAKADLEKKITHLQWLIERFKRLYSLTSALAQDEAAGHTRARLTMHPLPEKQKVTDGRPGTLKQAIVELLRETRRPMTAKEIWDVLSKRNVKINSDRPAEVVASTMRSSMIRNQNIFTKDGPRFGLTTEHQSSRVA